MLVIQPSVKSTWTTALSNFFRKLKASFFCFFIQVWSQEQFSWTYKSSSYQSDLGRLIQEVHFLILLTDSEKLVSPIRKQKYLASDQTFSHMFSCQVWQESRHPSRQFKLDNATVGSRSLKGSVMCRWAWRSIMKESIKYLWFQVQYGNDLGSLFVHCSSWWGFFPCEISFWKTGKL